MITTVGRRSTVDCYIMIVVVFVLILFFESFLYMTGVADPKLRTLNPKPLWRMTWPPAASSKAEAAGAPAKKHVLRILQYGGYGFQSFSVWVCLGRIFGASMQFCSFCFFQVFREQRE